MHTDGISYGNTFSLVAKMTTVRTLIDATTTKGWYLHQMDVKNTFSQGELEEEMYMLQPPGFELCKYYTRFANSRNPYTV